MFPARTSWRQEASWQRGTLAKSEIQDPGRTGRGGFGKVYRAYDPTVGRPVAVKVLELVSEHNRPRFRNEAVVAGNLVHRNMVTVYEYGRQGSHRSRRIALLYPGDGEVQSAAAGPIALLSDIGRAGREMLERNFQTVLDICDHYLAQYPDHVVFGELERGGGAGSRAWIRSEGQARAASEAVERYVQQIRSAVDAGDLVGAARLFRQAQEEHPEAGRLQEVGEELREIGRRRNETRELLARAQAAGESGRFEEWRRCLREAFEKNESDATVRQHVLSKLMEQAGADIPADWRRAEALLAEAASLQPGYAPPAESFAPLPIAGGTRPGGSRSVPAGAAASRAGIAGQDAAKARRKRFLTLGVIRAAAALSSGIFIAGLLRPPGEVAVKIAANVSGASISVGGLNCVTPNCALKLAPGTYTLQASAKRASNRDQAVHNRAAAGIVKTADRAGSPCRRCCR